MGEVEQAGSSSSPRSEFGRTSGTRASRPRLFAAIVFAAIAAGPLIIGSADLVTAPDLPPKALALFFLVAGIVAATAAGFLLFRPAATPPFIGAAASLAGIFAAGTILGIQYTNGDPTGWRVVWWSLLAVSGITLIVWGVWGGLDFLVQTSPWKTIGAVVTSTVLTGLVQFWYSTYYRPLHTPPQLKVSATLKQLGPRVRGLIPLDAHVIIENPTDARVRVLGTLYLVTATVPRVGKNAGFPAGVQAGVDSSVSGSSEMRFARLRHAVVQAGPVLPQGWFFDPKERFETHFLVRMPVKPPFSEAALHVQVVMAQGVRLKLGIPSFGPRECRQGEKHPPTACADLIKGVAARVTLWNVPRPTLLIKVTTAKRYVYAALIQRFPGQKVTKPYLFTLIDRLGRFTGVPSSEAERIGDSYNLSRVDSYFELKIKRGPRAAGSK